MKAYEIICDKGILDPVYLADSFFKRFRGLMMKKEISPNEGLLLENCSAIHCMFMRFTIDCVYLDEDFMVVGIETVKPWRIGEHFKGAKHVLELNEGKGSLFRMKEIIELKEKSGF